MTARPIGSGLLFFSGWVPAPGHGVEVTRKRAAALRRAGKWVTVLVPSEAGAWLIVEEERELTLRLFDGDRRLVLMRRYARSSGGRVFLNLIETRAYDESIGAVIVATQWVVFPDGTLRCDEDDNARSTNRRETFASQDVTGFFVAEPSFGEYADLLAHSPPLPTPTSPPRDTGL